MHNCSHDRVEVRWRNRVAGLIGRQCLDCGSRVGSWLRHAEVAEPEQLPTWSAMPDAVEDSARIGMVGPMDRSSSPRYVDLAAYRAYLDSEVWRRRRDKILERAGGVCEGCLTRQAVDVHHLTYRNVFAEFAFQLVALCRPCHDRVHAPPGEGVSQ